MLARSLPQRQSKEFQKHYVRFANAQNYHMRVPPPNEIKYYAGQPTPFKDAYHTPQLIGLSVDGVALKGPAGHVLGTHSLDAQLTTYWDVCNGAADRLERYHHVSTPLCTMRDAGMPTPPQGEWAHLTAAEEALEALGVYEPNSWFDMSEWVREAPDEAAASMTAWLEAWVDKWPTEVELGDDGLAPFKLGVALDGVPIYAPYDESGQLIAWGA